MRWSTRNRYIVYMSVLHLVLILLIYKLLFEDKPLFIASEVFLFLSIVGAIQLYRSFIRPNEFVRSGIEAIKDKDFTIKFVPTGMGEVDTLIEVYNLMIDQLREERIKLNEKHFFLEKLIAASPISIVILDFDNRIASFNVRAGVHFNVQSESVVGKTPDETGLPLLAEMGALADGESRIIKMDGVETFKIQRSHFMDQGFRRSFLMMEELTSEILESEKNAYGKVIRMMAHEVNNTLGANDSILQTTRGYLVGSEFSELNEALRIASDRNMRLTRFMRNFADVVRLPPPSLERTDGAKLVTDVAVFMDSFANRNGVIFKTDLNRQLLVYADPGQMEQVLVNVIKNAVESCEPGNRVEMEITDHQLIIKNNGKPISAEESNQLFNPFYSSKPNGQGIGLTLSREILLNHGFHFSLKTDGKGWTEFVILFKV
jgi:two-component system, NtrC family, nitrogen regulation sensor histidine kinase NtrY